MKTKEELYMQRALDLALNGRFSVAPNPMVGCVIVCNDRIIAEGWHEKFGEAHAEVNAIQSFKSNPQDGVSISESTIYVTLEPCAHFGKTPPCADLLVEVRPKRVVVACLDPNPLVAGKGIQRIREAGITVDVGVLEESAKELNKRFFTFQQKKRPYVLLKWAETSNGFIAPLDRSRKQVSGNLARIWNQKLRASEASILVGYVTARNDNPMLSNRWPEGANPLRIYFDSQGLLPPEHHLLDRSGPSLCLGELPPGVEADGLIKSLKIQHLEELMNYLFEQKILSLIVEGGRHTLQRFIEEELYDEICVLKSTSSWQEGLAAPIKPDLSYQLFDLGKDVLWVGRRIV